MTHFWLNDREIHTPEPPGMLVLDFLRRCRSLTGTKEGCREGDCGACAVLIGELKEGRVRYRAVTSCLVPLGELHGKHLVTIEGINTPQLTAIQQAIVDEGATQCGFCTPGIVVSLTGHRMHEGADVSISGIKEALGGHLCRCTGYRSLKAVSDHLKSGSPAATGVDALVEQGELPAYFRDMAKSLASIEPPTVTAIAGNAGPSDKKHSDRADHRRAAHSGTSGASADVERPGEKAGGDGAPDRFVVAGGTDIYVQRGDEIPLADVGVVNLMPRFHGIEKDDEFLRVGAATTFEEFANDPQVVSVIPDIKPYMFLVASIQIRNRATVGGNIVNASPIGDITILLMALDARLVMGVNGRRRTVPMKEFYLGYKEMDRRPGEMLEEIVIPLPHNGAKVNWEKVSKRKCLDIATVNSAACIEVEGSTIVDAALTMGGVAPVPLYLHETSRYLVGKRISALTVAGAARMVQEEVSPISDVRGSAGYKRLLARQLIIAHFDRMFPDFFRAEVMYETH